MAKRKKGGFGYTSPDKDTGWGLIFRMNKIFEDIEVAVPKGDFDKWNFLLDRLYVNIDYKEYDDIIIQKKKNGNGDEAVNIKF